MKDINVFIATFFVLISIAGLWILTTRYNDNLNYKHTQIQERLDEIVQQNQFMIDSPQ